MTMLAAPVLADPNDAALTPRPAGGEILPEELDRYDDEGLFELVDGRLVEKHMSALAHSVANNLGEEFTLWARPIGAGRSFVEAYFQCFPHAPRMVRRPDVAFVSAERLAGYDYADAHITRVPDLAVKVVSPSDEVYELDEKIADYFRAGVRRVWVINPEQRTLRAHSGPADSYGLGGDAELADAEVLPGFSVRLSSLFARPGAAAGPSAE